MEYIVCMITGYLLGCINPAWITSKIKKTDIEKGGTGNLGTTNTFIHFGKRVGTLVLILDFAKAILVVRVCQWLFPEMLLAGVIAGCMTIIGHIFPFYHHFKGGKGIAALGGFILAVDIRYFIVLLAVGCVLALIFNYGCSISFSAATLFPIIYAVQLRSVAAFLILALCSLVIMSKHLENIRKIREGSEMKIRAFLCQHIFGRSQQC